MNIIFCNNLKEARNSSGLTQSKVVELLNVIENCYTNWEQSRTEPCITDLQKLCVIFNITANKLLNIEDGEQERLNTVAKPLKQSAKILILVQIITNG